MNISNELKSLERTKRESWARVKSLKSGRARNKCEVCGRYFPDARNLRGHHLISLSNNGKDEDDNIIIVCKDCLPAIHAFTALEHAAKVLNIEICYMKGWRLLCYAFQQFLKETQFRVRHRQ